MGRDYWQWGTSGPAAPKSSKKLASSLKDSSAPTPTPTTTTAIPGCITAVFHLFDFHFPTFNHHTTTATTTTTTTTTTTSCSCFKPVDAFLSPHPTSTTIPKGAEAPRNSLESDEQGSPSPSPSTTAPPASLTSTSSSSKEEQNLNIPVGIQIKTRSRLVGPQINVDTTSTSTSTSTSTCSEISSSSPGTKTPTLVARLMGLDLLPEAACSPKYNNNNVQSSRRPPLQTKSNILMTGHRHSLDGDVMVRGTRSLPETPRISSARRSDSDVDHNHRLSLQINKENMSPAEELVLSRLSSLKRKPQLKQCHEDCSENRSPGHYARQIVKQVKESVSRKVGMVDITNTVRSREREQAREELVNQFKYKKISRALANKGSCDQDSSPGKQSAPSCSPRLRFLESKHKPSAVINATMTKDIQSPQPPLTDHDSANMSQSKLLQPVVEEEQDDDDDDDEDGHHDQKQRQLPQPPPPRAAEGRCKKGLTMREKFGSRLKKKPQQTSEEPFVRACTPNIPDKKCRKTPLSNDLLNISVPTLLPLKKDPSPPATKIPQKQVSSSDAQRPKRRLSSCSSQTYKKPEEGTHVHVAQHDNNGNINTNRCSNVNDAATISNNRNTTSTIAIAIGIGIGIGDQATAELEECEEYIGRILRRTGLDTDTPVSFTPWFSPSHPLDPSIFYYLEHFTATHHNHNYPNSSTHQLYLAHRCNRKLLFHLVDEILVQILKPYFNMKPWVLNNSAHNNVVTLSHMNGSELIGRLCSEIRRFPRADCRVLEDIDALIDKDLPVGMVSAYEEEGEGIVTDIEKDILESLVHETAYEFRTSFETAPFGLR